MYFLDPFGKITLTHTKTIGNVEITEYEFKHFLRNISKGNPSFLELLLSTEIVSYTLLSQEMRENAHMLVDMQQAFQEHIGYTQAMYREGTHYLNDMDEHRKVRAGKQLAAGLIGALRFIWFINRPTAEFALHDAQIEIIKDCKAGNIPKAATVYLNMLIRYIEDAAEKGYENRYNQDYIYDLTERSYGNFGKHYPAISDLHVTRGDGSDRVDIKQVRRTSSNQSGEVLCPDSS